MWDILDKYTSADKPKSRQEYLDLDDSRFRACFRGFFYGDLLGDIYKDQAAARSAVSHAEELLSVWRERGMTEADHDFIFAKALLEAVKDKDAASPLKSGSIAPFIAEKPEITAEDKEIGLRVIHDRRSVRAFYDKDIPDEILAKILAAGQHAAHVNNLQSIRYLLVNETHEPMVFCGVDIPPGRHHIAVLQDDRCYLNGSEKNMMDRILDAGAATQCMLLAMHAYGVDGAWLTFNDEQMAGLFERFDLPDYIRIVDLIDLGYGCQTPFPPQRPDVHERIVLRV